MIEKEFIENVGVWTYETESIINYITCIDYACRLQ
jgi:hypothetical protein